MKDSISRFINNGILFVKKYSPEILTVTGVLGIGAGTFMACKASTKLNDILTKIDDEKLLIKQKYEEKIDNETQTERILELKKEYNREMSKLYFHAIKELAKLYGPSFLVITGSTISLVGAGGILKKRNASLMAAYAILKDKYDTYRNNVKELCNNENNEHIKDLDEEDKNSVINEVNKTLANGTYKSSEEGKALVEYSEYARFFDESCLCWSKDPRSNFYFIQAQEKYANQLLIHRGHVLLNDVYDALGIPRTSEGAVVGWVYDPENPDKKISFGIYEIKSEAARRFVNGYEPSILLDFNVDGIIYDKITPSWRRIYE